MFSIINASEFWIRVGGRLYELNLKYGVKVFTYKWLALNCNVTPSSFVKGRDRGSLPKHTTVAKIAELLETTPGHLYTGLENNWFDRDIDYELVIKTAKTAHFKEIAHLLLKMDTMEKLRLIEYGKIIVGSKQ